MADDYLTPGPSPMRRGEKGEKHECFVVQADGLPDVRIHGDPDMPEETLSALMRMAELAIEAVARGEIGKTPPPALTPGASLREQGGERGKEPDE